LGIRQVQADIFVHQGDAGVLRKAHIFLRLFYKDYDHAFVMFDHKGCGQENRLADELASEVKQRLEQ